MPPQTLDDNRVYSYIRVSTAREEMISPELQVDHNERCAARENLEIIAHIYDLNESGTGFAKRKIAWIIGEVAAGRAGGVITWKYSRWGRNLLDSLIHIKELGQARGRLWSSTEPGGEMDTPAGKFSVHMLLAVAELQSGQIQETWLDTQRRRRENGLPGDGRPRFGYVYEKEPKQRGRYLQDPLTAPWLRSAYEAFVSGIPLSRIALDMQDAGILGTRGKPITNTALMFILDSGFGAGKIVRNARRGRAGAAQGEVEYLPGAHVPVISEDVWGAYLRRRQTVVAPRHANPVHRLSSLPVCGSCGRRMARVRDELSFGWACRNSRANSTRPCSRKATIRESKLEQAVWAWMTQEAEGDPGTELRRASAASQAEADVASIETQLKDRQRRLANLRHMRTGGEITAEEFKADRAELDEDIVRLKAAAASATQTARTRDVPTPSLFEALLVAWTLPDVAAVNAALKAVIALVVVNPVGVGDRVRVVPTWEATQPEEEDAPRLRSVPTGG